MRKNASEHAMRAGAPGWVGAARHPTLPEDEKEERGERWGWGVGGEREEERVRGELRGEARYMREDGGRLARKHDA